MKKISKKTFVIIASVATLTGIGGTTGYVLYSLDNIKKTKNEANEVVKKADSSIAKLIENNKPLTEIPDGEKNSQYTETKTEYTRDDVEGTVDKTMFDDIQNPVFITTAKDTNVKDSDIVASFNYKNEYRAYPIDYIMYHHLVNDTFGDTPVLISYCGICNSTAAFDPIVNGQTLSFGVLGVLLNNDLVVYDRQTDSWWAQITGEAFDGDMKDTKLKLLPGMEMVKYGEYKSAHPEGKVLQPVPGYENRYRNMGGPGDMRDGDSKSYEQVLGINVRDTAKMYKLKDIESRGIINDTVNGWSLLVLHDPDDGGERIFRRYISDVGVLDFELKDGKIVDKQTSSIWDFSGLCTEGKLKGTQLSKPQYLELYEYAWRGFYPNTLLYPN